MDENKNEKRALMALAAVVALNTLQIRKLRRSNAKVYKQCAKTVDTIYQAYVDDKFNHIITNIER